MEDICRHKLAQHAYVRASYSRPAIVLWSKTRPMMLSGAGVRIVTDGTNWARSGCGSGPNCSHGSKGAT